MDIYLRYTYYFNLVYINITFKKHYINKRQFLLQIHAFQLGPCLWEGAIFLKKFKSYIQMYHLIGNADLLEEFFRLYNDFFYNCQFDPRKNLQIVYRIIMNKAQKEIIDDKMTVSSK